uniref:Reverse transcriptase zinc-binding domain-containing protein n=1 Tax=Quercus lobata TaxID=97700 RepID=A0A7N2R7M9_QUELO
MDADLADRRYLEDNDTPMMKTIKAATTGFVTGTVFGTIVATWKDVPRVERNVALPGLIRTLKMMGSHGLTFAAIGGVYIGVEQLVQHYRMKRDFVNGAVGGFVAGASVIGFKSELGACLGSRVRHHQGAFEALRLVRHKFLNKIFDYVCEEFTERYSIQHGLRDVRMRIIHQGWPSFSRHILYDIGDGSRVKFWQDWWCGETSLAVRYPDLFRFCRNKDASVAELLMSTNGVRFWDVRFVRGVHARDLEAMSDFLETIYGSSIRGLGEDKMCWIPSKVKGFLVSDYYRILAGSAFFGFPWKSIWKQKIPSRVAFFVWTAALGKCLTIDNLRKRKIWILDWCYMYRSISTAISAGAALAFTSAVIDIGGQTTRVDNGKEYYPYTTKKRSAVE